MSFLGKNVIRRQRRRLTLARREQLVQQKLDEIGRYRLLHGFAASQPETSQAYQDFLRGLEKLEQQLAALQEAVALHPESSVL